MAELMSIGDFSELSGLSPKRLRSYAATGLLPPADVDLDSAYRYYSPARLQDARLIDALCSCDSWPQRLNVHVPLPGRKWLAGVQRSRRGKPAPLTHVHTRSRHAAPRTGASAEARSRPQA